MRSELWTVFVLCKSGVILSSLLSFLKVRFFSMRLQDVKTAYSWLLEDGSFVVPESD